MLYVCQVIRLWHLATLWHGKKFDIDAISDYVANIAFGNTVAALITANIKHLII
jgi:hypothetical protein